MSFSIDTNNFKISLSKASADEEHGNITLLEDTSKYSDWVYHFDGIKEKVCSKLRGGSKCSSCDALFIADDLYYLIEFKNQLQADIHSNEIKKKAFDSFNLLRLCFDQNISLDDLMQRTTLIIVYKPESIGEEGYESIKRKLREFADVPDYPIVFGLTRIKDILYHQIYTVDVNVFEEVLYPQIFQNHYESSQ